MSNVSEKKIRWIAITGTMASGKSAVLQLLKQLGYPTVDADAISFQLMQKGEEGYRQSVACFGKDILEEDGSINRRKLASIIFQNNEKKQKLESILHPLIRAQLLAMKKQNKEISFAEVPLLFEAGWEKDFDECWLITCSLETCIQRCMEERKMEKQEILERIQAQMSVEEKKSKADVVIENDHDLNELEYKLKERLKQYE